MHFGCFPIRRKKNRKENFKDMKTDKKKKASKPDSESSMFVSYCIKFRKHLTRHEERRRNFLEFHEYWAPMRRNTIEILEELKKSANEASTTRNKVLAVTKAVSVVGNTLSAIACYFMNPFVAITGKIFSAAANGVGAEVSAAASSKMTDIRKRAWKLLNEDLKGRKALIELGLQCNEIMDALENTIMELKSMDINNFVCEVSGKLYTLRGGKRLMNVISNQRWSRGHLPRDVVRAFIEFFTENQFVEGASEIVSLCSKFMETNPEAVDAASNVIQLSVDLYCLSKLSKEYSQILSIFNGGLLTNTLNAFFIFKDCYDIGKIWLEGIEKKSVTEEEIDMMLLYLKNEYDLLQKNYETLKMCST